MKTYAIAFIILVFNVCASGQSGLPIPYRLEDKWGFCDENGKIVIAPIYDTVSFFSRHPIFEAEPPYARKVEPIFNKPFAIVAKDSCYGLINQTGKEMVAIEHGRPLEFRKLTDSVLLVDGALKLKSRKYSPNFEALMDMNGNLLTGFDFSNSFTDFSYHYKCECYTGAESGGKRYGIFQYFKTFYHYDYVTELPGVDSKILKFSTNREQHQFQGFIDEKGNELLPAKYDWVTLFHNGIAIASKTYTAGDVPKREYFTIDSNGEPLKKLNFDLIHWDMIEGLAFVSNDTGKHYGLIDLMGNELLPQIFEDIYGVKNGLVITRSKKSNYSIFDIKGKLKLNFEKYTDFIPTKIGFYAKPKDGKWALYDQHCKIIRKMRVDSLLSGLCHDISTGVNYIEFQKDGKWGLLDENGKVILKPTYDEPFGYQLAGAGDIHYNQFYIQKKDGKLGLLNTRFQEILPFTFNKLEIKAIDKTRHVSKYWRDELPTHSLFSVNGDGHVGIIDSSGNIIVPVKYKYISPRFSGYSDVMFFGYYASTDDGEVQWLDKRGNLTQTNRLNEYIDTCSSSNYIRKYSESFYKEDSIIRQKGVDILGIYQGLCFTETMQLNDSLFVVYKYDKYGVAKPSGQMVIPIKYNKFEFWEKEQLLMVEVRKEGESTYGLMDLEGNVILPCIYDMINTTDTPGLLYVDLYGCKGFASTKGVVYFKE
ncbi:MAG: hypothetical protein GC192_07065 [Bacteroidetes bacterium]|nr:hypothetical protein [Bacteroidota bacterium]